MKKKSKKQTMYVNEVNNINMESAKRAVEAHKKFLRDQDAVRKLNPLNL